MTSMSFWGASRNLTIQGPKLWRGVAIFILEWWLRGRAIFHQVPERYPWGGRGGQVSYYLELVFLLLRNEIWFASCLQEGLHALRPGASADFMKLAEKTFP